MPAQSDGKDQRTSRSRSGTRKTRSSVSRPGRNVRTSSSHGRRGTPTPRLVKETAMPKAPRSCAADTPKGESSAQSRSASSPPSASASSRVPPSNQASKNQNQNQNQNIDIQQLWREYRKNPTDELRNKLMEYYLPLVKYNAERVHAKLPEEVDIEDLMQAGIFGLMDAIDAFDLDRGVKFETYCAPRIRGAILDELRSMDWVPRLVRSRSSQVEQARKALEMELGRTPTEEEIARKMRLTREEYSKIRKDAGTVGMTSLSRKWFETDSNKDICEIDVLEDAKQVNPFVNAQKQDLRELITKGLSRAERLIILLYYYEGMTMKEIGMTLDLSESRVSQMHSSILARLKAQLLHRSKELAAEIED